MTRATDTQVLAAARGGRAEPAGAPMLTRHRGGTGPPLVLLGWGSAGAPGSQCSKRLRSAATWLRSICLASAKAFRWPAPPRQPPRLADAVEAELDRLGLEVPAMVGNSLGGWVALELARRGRAARAVVISPSGLESPPERAYVIALNELMRLRARFGAPLGWWLTAPALARIALFGGLRGRPGACLRTRACAISTTSPTRRASSPRCAPPSPPGSRCG